MEAKLGTSIALLHQQTARHGFGRSCPQHLAGAFRLFRPAYLYSNGVLPAQLKKIELWRDTGEWVAFYTARIVGTLRPHTETYVWALRGREWVELRQFGVVGMRQRRFMGGR